LERVIELEGNVICPACKGADAGELPVAAQNKITVFTYVALPLGVILADEGWHPWFWEHFIQIYSRIYTNEMESREFRLEYLDRHSFSEAIDFSLLKLDRMSGVTDIIDLFR
jgi:hypothetical protein